MKTNRQPAQRSEAIEPCTILTALYSIDSPACRKYLDIIHEVLDAAEVGFFYQVRRLGANSIKPQIPYRPGVPWRISPGRIRVSSQKVKVLTEVTLAQIRAFMGW